MSDGIDYKPSSHLWRKARDDDLVSSFRPRNKRMNLRLSLTVVRYFDTMSTPSLSYVAEGCHDCRRELVVCIAEGISLGANVTEIRQLNSRSCLCIGPRQAVNYVERRVRALVCTFFGVFGPT